MKIFYTLKYNIIFSKCLTVSELSLIGSIVTEKKKSKSQKKKRVIIGSWEYDHLVL